MSNQNSTGSGFRPRKHADGREYVGGGRPYYIPSTDSNNYFLGDVVTLKGASNTADVTASGGVGGAVMFPAGTLPVVGAVTAGAGNAITGVIVHIGYDPVDYARPPYRKASVNTVVWVEDSPDVIYEVRLVGATLLTSTGINDTASVSLGAGGSTTTGTSSHGLDGTTLQTSTGTTYQLRLVGLSRDLLNSDLTSANPNVFCKINVSTEQTMASTAIGS